jgi:hypothetical protein
VLTALQHVQNQMADCTSRLNAGLNKR